MSQGNRCMGVNRVAAPHNKSTDLGDRIGLGLAVVHGLGSLSARHEGSYVRAFVRGVDKSSGGAQHFLE